MIVEGTLSGVEIDVKRLYLPGIVVREACPKCGAQWSCDLASRHLSYPVIGAPTELYGYCEDCEHEWSVKVVLKLSIEPLGEVSHG